MWQSPVRFIIALSFFIAFLSPYQAQGRRSCGFIQPINAGLFGVRNQQFGGSFFNQADFFGNGSIDNSDFFNGNQGNFFGNQFIGNNRFGGIHGGGIGGYRNRINNFNFNNQSQFANNLNFFDDDPFLNNSSGFDSLNGFNGNARNLADEFEKNFAGGEPLTPQLIGDADGVVPNGQCLSQDANRNVISAENHDLHILNTGDQGRGTFVFGTQRGAPHQLINGISSINGRGVFRFSGFGFGSGVAQPRRFKDQDGNTFILTRAITTNGLVSTCRYRLKSNSTDPNESLSGNPSNPGGVRVTAAKQ